jgi:hypothetical protein
MQIPTPWNEDKVACYEFAGTEVAFIDGIPRFSHRLQFVGFRDSARRNRWNIISRITSWFTDFFSAESRLQKYTPLASNSSRDLPLLL